MDTFVEMLKNRFIGIWAWKIDSITYQYKFDSIKTITNIQIFIFVISFFDLVILENMSIGLIDIIIICFVIFFSFSNTSN